MKPTIVGIATFIVAALIIDALLITKNPDLTTGTESPTATGPHRSNLDQILAAKSERETIPPLPYPSPTPGGSALLVTEECTAQRIRPNYHKEFASRVNTIIEGDTVEIVEINAEGEHLEIRLWGIDSPEMDQPYGEPAKQFLESIIPPGTKIIVYPIALDKDGRVVANIVRQDRAGGPVINAQMVEKGMAYHHVEEETAYYYYTERGKLRRNHVPCLWKTERNAKHWRAGVWETGNGGVRPWDHRKGSFQHGGR